MPNKKHEKGYLPLSILGQPMDFPMEATRQYVEDSIFYEVNDEKIILDLSFFSWIEFAIWTAAFILSLLVEEDEFYLQIITVATQILFFLLALSCILKYKKKIVFNRKEGTISYPRFFLPIQETIPFDQAKFLTGFVGIQGESFPCLRLRRKDGKTWVTFNTGNSLYYIYIWYMDRNRPLPPGTAFDPYREKDYQRRKAGGFPQPLYTSYVHTPDIGGTPHRYDIYTIDNPAIVELYARIIGE